MLKSIRQPIRSLSPMRLILMGVALLILIFLIIGTLNDRSTPASEFSFGLQTQPFLALAFLSFVGGLLSFASPCTLPILPAYFAFAFQSGRKSIALNTLVFMLGLGTMFSLLGAGASAVGRVLLQSKDLILIIGGSLVVAFGVMSLLGKGFTGFQREDAAGEASLGRSFLFGLTFAVGWTSCVGPILGTVLTLAATTGSVLRGMMLLFIYTLGLGLPLILVSTFFGRASRQSLFWRLLRGKGWQWNTYTLVVGLIWALAIWRILVAVAQYAFTLDFMAGRTFTAAHEIGLLVAAVAGVALWVYTGGGNVKTTLHLHSTQLVSGALFIILGLLLLSGQLASFNSLIPPDLAIWFADIEDRLIALFS
ncbi:MAG: cytochrome c biogenesis CcdA family protein [Chloroflexota bacterium]